MGSTPGIDTKVKFVIDCLPVSTPHIKKPTIRIWKNHRIGQIGLTKIQIHVFAKVSHARIYRIHGGTFDCFKLIPCGGSPVNSPRWETGLLVKHANYTCN